ncbi:MAG: LPS export ABC transporter periplasmic protein LptC [Flavobacteriales bacterium]
MSLTSKPTTSRPALWARAAVVFLGVGAWMGCHSKLDRDSSGEATETGSSDILREGAPIQVVEHGYFEYTERGKLVQALEANRLERWDNPEGEGKSNQENAPLWQVSEGFTLFIGGNRDRHAATLQADRGTYNDQAGRLEAWDNVVLVNNKGERLETEHLVWSHDSDLVYTKRPVSIETAQGLLRGRGLRSDSRFERYEILNPTGSFEVGD